MITEERYARAIGSRHLEARPHEEAPGDADTIIAAGMAEPLGVLLARLKAEWDSVSMVDAQNAANSLTARLMVLMNLRSLRPAKQAIFSFALSRAEGKGLPDPSAKLRAELRDLTAQLDGTMSPTAGAARAAAHLAKCREVSEAADTYRARLAALVGKVLDVWLDSLCHHCEGRGFNGGKGTPRVFCSHCGGTGSRRLGLLSSSKAEHQYGLWLLNAMDSKCSGSMGQMARKTRRA